MTFVPMICTRCLQRRAADALLCTPPPFPRTYPLLSTSRFLSSSSRRRATETAPSAATPPPPSPPFSTPFTPDPASSSGSGSDAATATNPADAPQKRPPSKTLAGTSLKGLGYLKNQDPPKAWEDHEYPDWLWGLLDAETKKKEAGGTGVGEKEGGDLFSKSKKQRRIAAKAARLAALDPSSQVPEIPLQHQSINLPYGEGNGEEELEGRQARQELKKTMRAARRKAIKERNFLTGMR